MDPEPQQHLTLTAGASAAGGPLPAAVLRHEGAPGGDHYDVLLAVRVPHGPDDAACATWRAAIDPAAAGPGDSLEVEPIHPHRAFYLSLAARHALDGGRGWVVPVRQGSWRRTDGEAIELRWNDGTTTVVAPLAIDRWRIER